MRSFGERLTEKRLELDKSIVEIAHQVGVSDQTIRNWEADKFKPGMENIELLCRVFGVDITYFLGSSEQYQKAAEASAAKISAEEVAAAVSNELVGITAAMEEKAAAVYSTAQAVHSTAQQVYDATQKTNKTVFFAAVIGACIFAFLAAIGIFLCVYTGAVAFSELAVDNYTNTVGITVVHFALAIFITSVLVTLTTVLSIFAAKIKKSSPPRGKSLETGSLLTNP